MGHYDECREGYCASCGAAPGNINADGTCPFCTKKSETPMKMSKKRQKELIELVEGEFDSSIHFDYYNWDGYIADEVLTDEELDWLRDNTEVVLIVQLKNKK